MNREFEKKMAQEVHTALSKSENKEEDARVLVALAKVLSDKKALNYSEGIISALKDLLEKEQGTVKVEAIVQQKLDEESKRVLINTLKEMYSARDIVLTETLDEKVLGGIKLKVGEEVYDATVKYKLDQLARQLQVTK